MSYVYDAHIFHYAVEGGLVFMCMADGDFGRRLPFAFIDDVVRRWTETYAEPNPNPNPTPNPHPHQVPSAMRLARTLRAASRVRSSSSCTPTPRWAMRTATTT